MVYPMDLSTVLYIYIYYIFIYLSHNSIARVSLNLLSAYLICLCLRTFQIKRAVFKNISSYD